MPLLTVPMTPVLEIADEIADKIAAQETAAGQTASGQNHRLPGLSLRHAAALGLLTLLAILVDGYHPYSEDAGIYVASLKQLAMPGLYPASGVFLSPYGHLSLFSHLGAFLLRALNLPLEAVLFALHLTTIWLFLYGSYELARRCFPGRDSAGRCGGTLLPALCLCVPVAGTSLSIMDPYLTGRSFSTPFTLLALCAVLDRRYARTCLFLGLAILFHPLMGAYAVGFALVLWAVQRRSWTAVIGITLSAIGTAAAVQLAQRPISESPAYRTAVASRTYFFLSQWTWYEVVGIAAPVALLALYALMKRSSQRPAHQQPEHQEPAPFTLAMGCTAMGLISTCVSLLFCHTASFSHRVAALQPLRPFLFVYISMFVIVGGLLGEFLLQKAAWRWTLLILVLGVSLGLAQHTIYPSSPHLEFPGTSPSNPWRQAFAWIRSHTPANAIVALDARYIDAPGEDSLGFRAVSERDSLADYSKDGGAAAVFPRLADRWLIEQTATTGLNQIDDRQRLHRLAPFHVSWMVLNGNAVTALPCPFATAMVKVCRLQ